MDWKNDGRVSLYINENMLYKQRYDLSLENKLFESLFAEIGDLTVGLTNYSKIQKTQTCVCLYISTLACVNT